jgi:hypothetical protein
MESLKFLKMKIEIENFNTARDEAIKGLERCDILPGRSEIEKLGYAETNYIYASEENEDHELGIFTKGEKRLVFLQMYIELEGGLYYQSLFGDKETVDEMEKGLVEASVRQPSLSLIETILYYKGFRIPGEDRLFPDNSIYSGCHHFIRISHDAVLAELAISNFKKLNSGEAEHPGKNSDERLQKVLLAIR